MRNMLENRFTLVSENKNVDMMEGQMAGTKLA